MSGDTQDDEPLTREEELAIRALKRLAKRWPKSLWLFSASGSLNVMRVGADGKRRYLPDSHAHDRVNPRASVCVIDIPNDGGDW